MMKKRSVRLNSRGFTLVELLVVIAILALLAGIGVPQVMRTLARSRIVADTTAIESVQAAFDAWRSECGIENSQLAGFFPSGNFGTSDNALATAVTANSLIDGQAKLLNDFIEGGKLPKLKSTTVTQWSINQLGQIYVNRGSGQTPQYVPQNVTNYTAPTS